jgi:hypothetical protein
MSEIVTLYKLMDRFASVSVADALQQWHCIVSGIMRECGVDPAHPEIAPPDALMRASVRCGREIASFMQREVAVAFVSGFTAYARALSVGLTDEQRAALRSCTDPVPLDTEVLVPQCPACEREGRKDPGA